MSEFGNPQAGIFNGLTRFWASTGREQQVMLGPGAVPDGPALPGR